MSTLDSSSSLTNIMNDSGRSLLANYRHLMFFAVQKLLTACGLTHIGQWRAFHLLLTTGLGSRMQWSCGFRLGKVNVVLRPVYGQRFIRGSDLLGLPPCCMGRRDPGDLL
jgi:hypothetical protein